MPAGGQPCALERGISPALAQLRLERIERMGAPERLPLRLSCGDGGEVVPRAPVLVGARKRTAEIAPGGGVPVACELRLACELERARSPRHPTPGMVRRR